LDKPGKIHESSHKIPWHLVIIFLLLTVSIGTIGHFYYQKQKETATQEKLKELSAIADLKVDQIENWRSERMKDASFIFNNPRIAELTMRFQQDPSAVLKKEILSWMKSMYENQQYREMHLLGREMNPLVSLPEKNEDICPEVKKHLQEVLSTKRLSMSDLFRNKASQICMDIVIPLISPVDENKSVVGFVALQIDPYGFLYPLIQSWPISSETAESLLVRREGDEVIFLNELRHQKNTAFAFRSPITKKNLPAAMAVSGIQGEVEGVDYRGIPVLAAIKQVPGSPWFLIAKIDDWEVHARHYIGLRLIAILTGILIVASGLTIGIFWRHQRSLYYRTQFETELQRRKIEEERNRIFNYSIDMLSVADFQGYFKQLNPAWEKTLGWTPEELMARPYLEFIHPEDRNATINAAQGLAEGNPVIAFENRYACKDGSYKWMSWNSFPLAEEGIIFAVVRDVTGQKKTLEDLRLSEDRFRELFRYMSSGVAVYKPLKNGEDFIFEDMNRAGEQITKVKRSDVMGKSVLKAFPEVKEIGLFEVFQRVWRSGKPAMHPVTQYNDEKLSLWVQNYVYKLPSGEIVAIFDDITDRKKAEEALHENEAFIRAVLDSLPIGIAVNSVDPLVKFEYMNDNFPKYYRTTREKLADPDAFWDVVYEDQEFKEKIRKRVIEDCASGDLEKMYWEDVPISRKGDQTAFVSARNIPVPYKQLMISLVWDVTKRKYAEDELKKYREHLEDLVEERTLQLAALNTELASTNIKLRELDRLKSMFIASMSHELRTPLNSIIGFTGIILQGLVGEINEEQKKQLTIVKNSAKHLLDLINDVIDLSKIEAGKVELLIEEFDLDLLLREVYETLKVSADKKGLGFSLDMPDALIMQSDRRRIKQVLMNLGSNAVKYTDKGSVNIKVKKMRSSEVPKNILTQANLTLLSDHENVIEISVDDTGIGIHSQDMGILFTAFGRIHAEGMPIQEGTGLGLYLSNKLAYLLGGSITTESEFGKGSKFRFILPMTPLSKIN